MKHLFLIIAILNASLLLIAQNPADDSKLALEYYRNKEFEKASVLYEKLFQATASTVYLDYYLRCLIELSEFKTAEKTVARQLKKNPGELSYYVELGHLLKSQGREEEGTEQYEIALKKIQASRTQIINLANAFIRKSEHEYAEKVYLKGRKLMRDNYDFNLELAGVYQYLRSYRDMFRELFDLLEKDDAFIQTVQNRLQNAVYSDLDNDLTQIIKNSLLLRIQQNPDKIIFSELLIWQYIQDRDYDNAMIQAVALDKRLREKGERLLALGRLAVSGKEYDVAVRCYNYVIEQGSNLPYYFEAKSEHMAALYNKIINSGYTYQELQELENNMINTLGDIGETKETFGIIKDLSHLQAFYLNKQSLAIERLERALTLQGFNRTQTAECKTELGDILLLSGEVWEATLYYAQVQKANPDNPLGHEAQFRKAKLAYYAGDFKWAQAQLDVLKASTSKLIANDAFELSQLISDNTILDTTEAPMRAFSRGDFLLFQNKDSLALLTFDSVLSDYPAHTLDDEVMYRKAKVMQRKGNYEQAAEYLQKIVDGYSYDILADDATYYLAMICEQKLGDRNKAQELYKRLLLDYPGSIYVVDARKRYRALRGDEVSPEEKFFYDLEPNP
ncbi:MAG: tetratricopeptide repeat protein [Bacteroidetes bacterium]|nr:tetratricopeptide repeat protein [Bacteroidota bacterium]